jgi:hypothetical protein
MYSSRLFQELESWTKALVAMQNIIALAVKMVDYSEKKVLYVSQGIGNSVLDLWFYI